MLLTFLYILACSLDEKHPNNGWEEITPPRHDLQCWDRWDQPNTTVCVEIQQDEWTDYETLGDSGEE